jgi:hypothetical protein
MRRRTAFYRVPAVVAAAVVTMVTIVASPAAWALTAPTVPAAIAVPAGNTLFLVGHARGAQVYTCTKSGETYGWTLRTPAAVLYDDAGHAIIQHYAGPTWRANDGSAVVAARIASAPAPTPNAIPWLLLQTVSTTPGNGGGTTLVPTTYIQRINTTGGVAPATGCDGAHVGATRSVFYTADYYFYRAA